MENEIDTLLLIQEEDAPVLTEEEGEEFQLLIKDFVEYYVQNQDKPVEEWLRKKMQENLLEKTAEEVQKITEEIITTIRQDEENKKSLSDAIENGRSKESWFASEIVRATSAMSTQKSVQYLNNLDTALKNANESLYRTITTQAGVVSQNPRLDGFIAEQYHAQTFNLNAEAKRSPYRAKVLEPTGNGYAKNSVDIEIVDGSGKVVRRYQSKYCKDANATERAFNHGDYRGQQKLVPDGQESEIAKKVSNVLEAPDGTTSNPLTKSRAEQMRNEAQSGKWNELNWNEYKTKDLAVGVGKQAGYAALQGAAIGVGVDVAQKLWNGEKIEGEKVVKTALTSGADFGMKAAVAGALKVGVEKEIIRSIPKETPTKTISNIAFVAVEDAKIVGKMMSRDLSFKEGINQIEQTTIATAVGLMTMEEGTALGLAAGIIFGPIGATIGGFVGGTIGYMAGSKVGETIVKGAQKIRDEARKNIKTVVSNVKETISDVTNGIENFCKRIANAIVF